MRRTILLTNLQKLGDQSKLNIETTELDLNVFFKLLKLAKQFQDVDKTE